MISRSIKEYNLFYKEKGCFLNCAISKIAKLVSTVLVGATGIGILPATLKGAGLIGNINVVCSTKDQNNSIQITETIDSGFKEQTLLCMTFIGTSHKSDFSCCGRNTAKLNVSIYAIKMPRNDKFDNYLKDLFNRRLIKTTKNIDDIFVEYDNFQIHQKNYKKRLSIMFDSPIYNPAYIKEYAEVLDQSLITNWEKLQKEKMELNLLQQIQYHRQ